MVRETGHYLLSIILCSKNSTTCVEVFLPVFYSNDQLMCIGDGAMDTLKFQEKFLLALASLFAKRNQLDLDSYQPFAFSFSIFVALVSCLFFDGGT